MFLAGKSKGLQHTVVTAISLVIMAPLSPNCPFHTGCLCMCVCGAYYVYLSCSPPDNLITTFSNAPTYRSNAAMGKAAPFWQGSGLWDVCVGGHFFLFCFSFSGLWVIIYTAGVIERSRTRVTVKKEKSEICRRYDISWFSLSDFEWVTLSTSTARNLNLCL